MRGRVLGAVCAAVAATLVAGGVSLAQSSPGADLAMSMAAPVPTGYEGDTFPFDVTLTNNGPETASDARFTVFIHSGLEYVSGPPSCAFSAGSGDVTCPVGSMPLGASVTVRLLVRVREPGHAPLYGHAASYVSDTPPTTQFDPNLANNDASASVFASRRPVNGPPPPPPGPPANRAPVTSPDSWSVRPGLTVDGNVLENDRDPDGDPITARVLSTSFASREWSRMDRNGGFLYSAGVGTRRRQVKRITYVAVDSKGARSLPQTAAITVTPVRPARRPPRTTPRRRGRQSARAAAAPRWEGPYSGYAQLCFGSGLNASCYTMLSVARTRAFNQQAPWVSYSGAETACLKYGLIPLKNADCARKLLGFAFTQIANKSVIRNAANFGDCLMFKNDRNRTLSQPRAGEWTKPQYATDDSLVSPWNGRSNRFSGYGYWRKGFSGKWRIPLWCHSNGSVYRRVNQALVDAG